MILDNLLHRFCMNSSKVIVWNFAVAGVIVAVQAAGMI
jgi:hypothetical protein